jgi:hypothetical protein
MGLWWGLQGLALLLSFWKKPILHQPRSDVSPTSKTSGQLLLAGATMLNLGLFGWRTMREPLGKWDAMAIWNLHARFLFRGGPHWTDYLTQQLRWTHPDYPMLLPGAIAAAWTMASTELAWVPAVVAAGFTFSTMGLLAFGLSSSQEDKSTFPLPVGVLAALALLGSPYWLVMGAAQYADIPLGYFLLASIMMLKQGLDDTSGSQNHKIALTPWILAGCLTFLAAWTKNEGLVFALLVCACLMIVWTWRWFRQPENQPNTLRALGGFALGAAPVLLTLLVFKAGYAPPRMIWCPRNRRVTCGAASRIRGDMGFYSFKCCATP